MSRLDTATSSTWYRDRSAGVPDGISTSTPSQWSVYRASRFSAMAKLRKHSGRLPPMGSSAILQYAAPPTGGAARSSPSANRAWVDLLSTPAKTAICEGAFNAADRLYLTMPPWHPTLWRRVSGMRSFLHCEIARSCEAAILAFPLYVQR